MLYDNNAANFLLGAIFNSPKLLLEDKYPLTKDDFYNKKTKDGNRFHMILFVVARELALSGVTEVKGSDVGEFLKSYPKQLQVLEDSNYLDYILTVKELGGEEDFAYYYDVVRKLSMLRAYRDSGFDVSEIYDEETDSLNELTIEDIASHFEGKCSIIAKHYHANQRLEEYRAGSNAKITKEQFKETPLFGASFQSPYLNAIFRGLYGFVLRSGNSGSGKTAYAVGDLCKMCVTEYYDSDKGKWVKNKSRVGAGLFINTEMELEKELEPIALAWIADVSRSHYMDGYYAEGEEERINHAIEVLYDSEIYFVDDPNFTIKSLSATIGDYALNKGVKVVAFDYVASQPFIQAEVSKQTKVSQREDMILLAETDALKQLSRKYNVGILSGTQLNARDNEIKYVNESLLMGGKGQVRKVDGCAIMMPITKIEMEYVDLFYTEKKFGVDHVKPNVVLHIVKGRANKYGKYIKVYQYLDLATGRTKDICVTDRDNNPIEVEKLIIEYS